MSRDLILEEIAAERLRHIQAEGFSFEHDGHELMHAAMLYFHHGTDRFPTQINHEGAPMGWPWELRWWKPKDRRRNLIRAGALMVAEKDRLLRRDPKGYVGHVHHKLERVIADILAIDAEAAHAADAQGKLGL